jgi:hypothetical protein
MKKALSVAVIFMLVSFVPDQKKIKIFLAGDSTMSIKLERKHKDLHCRGPLEADHG